MSKYPFALNEQGVLFLGKAEMLLTHSNLFVPLDLKHRVFTKVPTPLLRDRLLVLTQAGRSEANNHVMRQVQLRDIAFDTGGDLLGATFSFDDVTHNNQLHAELEKSKQELETAYEELQATNEELETMNEQLQASNQEMQAVNAELHHRTDELNRVNALLGSILSSLLYVAVVLDRDFTIVMWNEQATELWGLRADEVRGRSILGLDIGLPVEQLRSPVRALVNGEGTERTLILSAITRRGKAIQCRITCTLLFGAGEVIDGVILLMEALHEDRSSQAHPDS
jgi:PAS domain S-box-containing protein